MSLRGSGLPLSPFHGALPRMYPGGGLPPSQLLSECCQLCKAPSLWEPSLVASQCSSHGVGPDLGASGLSTAQEGRGYWAQGGGIHHLMPRAPQQLQGGGPLAGPPACLSHHL